MHIHPRKHACHDSKAVTAQGSGADTKGSELLFCSIQSTKLSTFNARTSWYPLLKTHNPIPSSPVSQKFWGSSQTAARLYCLTLIQTQSTVPKDVHPSCQQRSCCPRMSTCFETPTSTPHSCTMAPCIVAGTKHLAQIHNLTVKFAYENCPFFVTTSSSDFIWSNLT